MSSVPKAHSNPNSKINQVKLIEMNEKVTMSSSVNYKVNTVTTITGIPVLNKDS